MSMVPGSDPFLPEPYRFAPIHAEAPEFIEMSVEQEILVTGIKVVDLLAPYAKGGKIGTLVFGPCFPNTVKHGDPFFF